MSDMIFLNLNILLVRIGNLRKNQINVKIQTFITL